MHIFSTSTRKFFRFCEVLVCTHDLRTMHLKDNLGKPGYKVLELSHYGEVDTVTVHVPQDFDFEAFIKQVCSK